MSSVIFITKNPWKTFNNEDIFKRYYFACGVYRDRFIIVTGGNKRNCRASRPSLIYDFHKRKSFSLPDLSLEGRCTGAVLKDYFYVSEYYSDGLFSFFVRMQRISISTNTNWETVEPPIKLKENTVLSDGNYLFLVSSREIHRYDPIANEIAKMQPIPTPRENFATAVDRNYIFVIGGLISLKNRTDISSVVEIFNTSTQSWHQAPSLPVPLYLASAVVFERWIIVTGGRQEFERHNDRILVFDTFHQQWTQNFSISSPYQRICHCSLKIGSQMITLGGRDEMGIYCPMERMQINDLVPDWNWEITKHFILLRQLLDKGRATYIVAKKKVKTDTVVNVNDVIQQLFNHIGLDMFRNILSFLIHTKV